MRPPAQYRGREQTYVKHLFLEQYLERVAYNIGSFAQSFVYVDCFSGPWQSTDERYEDTSFVIALNQLRAVRQGLAEVGRHPKIRCFFLERSPVAYERLQNRVGEVTDIEVCARRGEFESSIGEILDYVGRDFALFFIDPTGWTGFGLSQIQRLLQHEPSEVIVNFMFNHINRFLESKDEAVAGQFNELFGGPGWEAVVDAEDRERAIIDFYCERLGQIGRFPYVTYTRVLNPVADRTYFYLVYGTRHTKGLREFRRVESRAVCEQELVRLDAKQTRRVLRTGQTELFGASDLATDQNQVSFDAEKVRRLEEARATIRAAVVQGEISYEELLPRVLVIPLVWESDYKDLIIEARDRGELEILGMRPRQRRPQDGHRFRGRSQ